MSILGNFFQNYGNYLCFGLLLGSIILTKTNLLSFLEIILSDIDYDYLIDLINNELSDIFFYSSSSFFDNTFVTLSNECFYNFLKYISNFDEFVKTICENLSVDTRTEFIDLINQFKDGLSFNNFRVLELNSEFLVQVVNAIKYLII